MAKKKQSTIKFLKTREVKSPERGHPTSAGIDFFVPQFNKSFIRDLVEKNPKIFGNEKSGNFYVSGNVVFGGSVGYQDTNQPEYTEDKSNKYEDTLKFDPEESLNYILLRPHQGLLIPSGIHCRMQEPDRALIAKNKSGIASKKGIIFGAQVIDYEYQGEMHINVINTSTDPIRIYEDMKIIQFVETPIFTSEIETSEASLTEAEGLPAFDKEIKEFYKGHESNRGAGGFGSTDKIQK